jgi:hypothetical protein
MAAASGNALLRAVIYPVSNEQPVLLGNTWSSFPSTYGGRRTAPVDKVDSTATLDALASPSPDLVATAADIINRLGQAFGAAELPLLTERGEVRVRFFGRSENQMRVWAEANNVEVLEATNFD